MFRWLFLILLIVLVVVAFNRGWVSFSWNEQDKDKNVAALTIDKDKIKEDVHALTDKARQAVQPNASGSTLHGTVEAVTADELRLRTVGEKSVTVRITPRTTIHRGEREITAADLAAGQKVTVDTTQGEATEARAIRVDPE